MASDINGQATVVGELSPGAQTVPVYQTRPERLTLHAVEEHELQQMMNVTRPLTLAGAGAFAGGLLGAAPGAVSAIATVGSRVTTTADVVNIAIGFGCLVGLLICAPVAVKGQVDANRIMAAVRARQARLV